MNKLAAGVAAVLVPAIVNALRPELEKLVNEARGRINDGVQDAIQATFMLLDTNKDGKLDYNDVLARFRK